VVTDYAHQAGGYIFASTFASTQGVVGYVGGVITDWMSIPVAMTKQPSQEPTGYSYPCFSGQTRDD